ncbi:MAG: PAS domain-containing protein, partial [Desulfarculaceae bacterium]
MSEKGKKSSQNKGPVISSQRISQTCTQTSLDLVVGGNGSVATPAKTAKSTIPDTLNLSETSPHYQVLLEALSSPAFLCRLDAQGRPQSIVAVNQQALSLLGYSRTELSTISPEELLRKDNDLELPCLKPEEDAARLQARFH